MADEFNQAKYWVKRHEDLKDDPRSVGTLAHTREANERGEIQLKLLMSTLAKYLAEKGAKTILDLGCGHGRVASCFVENGFDYIGVDISPVAIETARLNNPKANFLVGNLSAVRLDGQYDVVTVLYVFVHFVNDELWRNFLFAAMQRVKPGGVLMFADAFSEERKSSVPHVVTRPLAEYTKVFDENGFKFDHASRQFAKDTGLSTCNQFYFARRES